MAVQSAGESDPFFIQRQISKQATTLKKHKAAVLQITSSLRSDKYDKYKRFARPTAAAAVDTYTPSSRYTSGTSITQSAFTAFQKRKKD
ncbi:MAG: hypothetical protein LIQ31_06515 [Planctomycetes bacterium]|nr:hypothetical protein [Planctomycetota bacterium]